MIRVLKLSLLKTSLLIFFSFIITDTLISSEIYFTPPDTVTTDTSKNIVIIYDTVKTQKIIYVYDTVLVYDTLYLPDTFNYQQKPYKLGLDLTASIFYPLRKLSAKNTEYNDLILFKNNTEIMQAGYSVSSELSFNYKKWKINTGLMFTQINQKANINIYEMTFFPDDTMIINDNSFWNVTVIDTFYQVFDSTLTPVIVLDSNWVADVDTSLISDYDTLLNNQSCSELNKYLYFELPLIIGNEIYSSERTSLYAKIGLISSFLMRVSGKTILPPDEFNIISLEDCPLIKTNFHLYAGIQFNYKLYEQMYVFSEMYYKYMLNRVYNKSLNLSEKIDITGIKIGLSYYF